jgi:hypothetical protein
VAAEYQEALTLSQTEEALKRFFEVEHVVGIPGPPWLEWLPLIIDVFGEHMRAEHPPRWVYKNRCPAPTCERQPIMRTRTSTYPDRETAQ